MESRILREAMTAYQAVYDPELRQQLEENQAFENWVNSLVEEGHDLSEYTWEEMYDVYVNEGFYSDVWANRGKIGSAVKGAVSGASKLASGVNRAVGGTIKQAASGAKQTVKDMGTGFKYAGTGGAAAALGANISRGIMNAGKPPSKPPTSAPKPSPAPAAKPTPKPSPAPAAKPTPKPSPAPAAKPTPKPAATAPSAKPAPTASAKPPSGPGYKKDTSITDMIGRSQIRQGAPINTGSASSDIRSMALRGTLAGGSTPSPTSKSAPSRPMGSRKPGSIVSGLDMFDLVKGYLLDEGYADTEEAAIKIMANMSEEWRQSIISEAPGEWFGGLRDKARASRAAQMQKLQPTPKPGPTVSSPFAKPASRNDSGKLTTYGAGGGSAAERKGQTRSQVMQQGAKNLETKNKSNPGPNFGR